MLSYKDCLGLCDLTEAEIDAIAEHEHLPRLVALELGEYLIHSPEGVPMIRKMIVDDIAHARRHGDLERVLTLRATLRHFIQTHPDHVADA